MLTDLTRISRLSTMRSIKWKNPANYHFIDRIIDGSCNMSPETILILDQLGCMPDELQKLNGVIGEKLVNVSKATKNMLKELSLRTGIDFFTCDEQCGFSPDEVRVLHCCIFSDDGKTMNTFTLRQLKESHFFA